MNVRRTTNATKRPFVKCSFKVEGKGLEPPWAAGSAKPCCCCWSWSTRRCPARTQCPSWWAGNGHPRRSASGRRRTWSTPGGKLCPARASSSQTLGSSSHRRRRVRPGRTAWEEEEDINMSLAGKWKHWLNRDKTSEMSPGCSSLIHKHICGFPCLKNAEMKHLIKEKDAESIPNNLVSSTKIKTLFKPRTCNYHLKGFPV